MMKKLFLFLLTIITLSNLNAQTAPEKNERLKFKNLPGNFIFDLGLTRYRFYNDDMKLRLFGSRGANIYYTYDIKLVNNLSFSPGIGVGITNYFFSERVTIKDSSQIDQMFMDKLGAEYGTLKKSKLNANYIDIPLEFRWRSSSDVNSFKIAIGAKAGVLVSAHTKIKYKEDGMKREKLTDDFELNRFRYGVYGRIGYGSFHVFGYYSLSELFNEGKAPGGRSIVPYMVGITISAF
jgi:hypothetical protein